MSPRAAFLKWSLLGGLCAVTLVLAQANEVGGLAGMLQVGESSAVRPLIESELGEIPLAPHSGHDGQISYAIGLDLLGREVPELLDHGAYRYRRMLYPAAASVFGLLEGEALLVGMVVVALVSTAAAAGLAASIGARLGWSDWAALAVILNPGVWLSLRLLTSDTLAVAMMLLGLDLVLRNGRTASAAFSLSVLAKDAYLVTPGGLAISRDKSRWPLLIVPVAVLAVWVIWLTATMGEGFSGRGNLGLPIVGFVAAFPIWTTFDLAETLYLGFALLSVGLGLVYSLLRKSWLRWSILAWSVLGVVSTDWVWDLGNNAARAFAPIVILVVLAEAARRGRRDPVDDPAGLQRLSGRPGQ